MENEDLRWPAAVGAAVVLFIFFALTMTITGQWHWFLDPVAASWVQAIVAIIAIFAAAAGLYWQAGKQHRVEAARVTAEEVRRLHIMWSAVFDLRARLKACTWHELGPFEVDWDRVDEAVALLRAIPLFEAPDWRVAFATRQAVDSYALLRRSVPYPHDTVPPKEWFQKAYELVETSIAHCLRAQKHIEEGLRSRKATVPVIELEFVGYTVSSNDED